MPSTVFATLPTWLQVIIIVGSICGALIAIIVLISKIWPALNLYAKVSTLDDLQDFMIDTAATLAAQDVQMKINSETLAKQAPIVAGIYHETHRNNGSSLKDAQVRTEEAVQRIEVGIAGIYVRLDSADVDRAKLRADLDLEVTRPKTIRNRTPKTKETP